MGVVSGPPNRSNIILENNGILAGLNVNIGTIGESRLPYTILCPKKEKKKRVSVWILQELTHAQRLTHNPSRFNAPERYLALNASLRSRSLPSVPFSKFGGRFIQLGSPDAGAGPYTGGE